jgi:hypothetical protein
VQLPQDPAKDLPVVAPRLATPTVDGQQGLHSSQRLVSELQHPAASWLVVSRSATLPSATTSSSKVRL